MADKNNDPSAQKNVFGEALTEEQFLEYKRRMEEGENIIIHDLRKPEERETEKERPVEATGTEEPKGSNADDNNDYTSGGVNIKNEMAQLKDLPNFSLEQLGVIYQVLEAGIRAEELNDLDLKNMTADQIKTTKEGFYGLKFGQ